MMKSFHCFIRPSHLFSSSFLLARAAGSCCQVNQLCVRCSNLFCFFRFPFLIVVYCDRSDRNRFGNYSLKQFQFLCRYSAVQVINVRLRIRLGQPIMYSTNPWLLVPFAQSCPCPVKKGKGGGAISCPIIPERVGGDIYLVKEPRNQVPFPVRAIESTGPR